MKTSMIPGVIVALGAVTARLGEQLQQIPPLTGLSSLQASGKGPHLKAEEATSIFSNIAHSLLLMASSI